MGRKLNVARFQVYTDSDTATNPTSTATSVHQIDHVSYDIEIDSSVNATLSVEYSTDSDNTVNKTWLPVEFGTTITLDGATDTQANIVFREMPYKALRLKVTNSGGTGNINAWISGQSRGA